jgi:predicted Rossmann-fold nucleotide-binding protein
VAGYWGPLLAWLDHAVASGFVAPLHRELLVVSPDLAGLLEAMGFG